MPEPHLAFLSRGKLHLRRDQSTAVLESQFARGVRERAISIERKHAWKTQGRGAQFMGGLWGAQQAADPGEVRIAITGVAARPTQSQLLYSLETDAVSGIFSVDQTGFEQRHFHTADFRIRQIALHADGQTLAATVFHNDIRSNIAVLQVEGTEFLEVTEGDSFDQSPRWVPGQRRVVFQSAGVGRDPNGRFAGVGPFSIQELEVDSGELGCTAEQEGRDLLMPQKDSDGALYYVRRPYAHGKTKVSPLGALKDAALFPFRMGHAVFEYFNTFSKMYTGKPLISAKGAAQRQMDPRQMMIHGNLVSAELAAREGAPGDADAPSLVPPSWELVRQGLHGKTEVLAKSVLAYDLASDGSILYTDGSAIRRLTHDRKRDRLLVGELIEQIVLL